MIEEYYFKEPLNKQKIISAEPSESVEENPDIGKKILCRNCHADITEKDYELRINDSDFHLFKNPMGIYFRVVCFKNADGCIIISDYTDENTWFKGYIWAIVLCRTCHTHLGWHYKSLDSKFFGLIADRLTGI